MDTNSMLTFYSDEMISICREITEYVKKVVDLSITERVFDSVYTRLNYYKKSINELWDEGSKILMFDPKSYNEFQTMKKALCTILDTVIGDLEQKMK